MGLTLLIGGARSGKSSLAVRLAAADGGLVAFIATGEASDDEMAERIARHQAERPPGWRTIEAPQEVGDALASVPDGDCVVIDCLSLWVANLYERPVEEIEREAVALAKRAAARAGRTIAVTNEVGLGIVPVTPLGREYRDVLGRVNAIWAAAAAESFFVVAGRVLRLEAPDV